MLGSVRGGRLPPVDRTGLIDEGDVYNTRLWELSILRLNQLGYFEALKAEDAVDVKRDQKTSTVDLTLKVKEKGKNSVSLNGGVSGISGSFLGFGYSTNNLVGLGETLSLQTTLGTVQRDVTLGFTEPYFLDRPMQVPESGGHLTALWPRCRLSGPASSAQDF